MGTQQRRERERRQRRQDILDVARALFWEQGYGGTTMPQIAEAAELAPGTLYLYFPGKSALYAELLLEGYDVLVERLQAELKRDASVRRHGEALVDVFFQFALDAPEYFDIIFFVIQRETGGDVSDALEPDQVERLHAKEDACKDLVAQMLERAGYMRSPDELQATVDAIWSMLVGTVFVFRKTGRDRFSAVARQARQLLVGAFFGDAEGRDL